MNIYRDQPQIYEEGSWQFCQPGAKVLPFAHAFGSRQWDLQRLEPDPPLGELLPRGVWQNGKGNPRNRGRRFCGDEFDWQHGSVYPAGNIDDCSGIPACCMEPLTCGFSFCNAPSKPYPFQCQIKVDFDVGFLSPVGGRTMILKWEQDCFFSGYRATIQVDPGTGPEPFTFAFVEYIIPGFPQALALYGGGGSYTLIYPATACDIPTWKFPFFVSFDGGVHGIIFLKWNCTPFP